MFISHQTVRGILILLGLCHMNRIRGEPAPNDHDLQHPEVNENNGGSPNDARDLPSDDSPLPNKTRPIPNFNNLGTERPETDRQPVSRPPRTRPLPSSNNLGTDKPETDFLPVSRPPKSTPLPNKRRPLPSLNNLGTDKPETDFLPASRPPKTSPLPNKRQPISDLNNHGTEKPDTDRLLDSRPPKGSMVTHEIWPLPDMRKPGKAKSENDSSSDSSQQNTTPLSDNARALSESNNLGKTKPSSDIPREETHPSTRTPPGNRDTQRSRRKEFSTGSETNSPPPIIDNSNKHLSRVEDADRMLSQTRVSANGSPMFQRASNRNSVNEGPDKRSISSEVRSIANDFAQKVRHTLGDMSKRYPPLQKMFREASTLAQRLTPKRAEILAAIKSSLVNGLPAFNLSKLSENDALRLLEQLERIPDEIKNNVTGDGGVLTMSTSDMHYIPLSIIPTLTEEKVAEFNALPEGKLGILCSRLMTAGASPWILRSAIEAGFNCTLSPVDMETREAHKMQRKKGLGRALSKVMMAYIRESQAPNEWNSDAFVAMVKALAEGITIEDIRMVPENVLRNSMKNISMVEFPFKSQVRAMVDHASSVYRTPTAWPEAFVTSLGPLLEYLEILIVSLLDHNAVYDLAEELEDGIKKPLTRVVLGNSILTILKNKPQLEDVAAVIPWLKGELDFLKDLSPNVIVETFRSNDLSAIPFTAAEKHSLADKVEQLLMTNQFGSDTDEYMLGLGAIVEGFSYEFIEWVPDYLTPKITQKVPIRQFAKAKRMISKLKKHLRKGRLSASEARMLFSGLELSDIDAMSMDELTENLEFLRTMKLPFHIGNKIVRKLERHLLRENKTGCNMAFSKFGDLAVHISPRVIEDEKYVPVSLEDADLSDCPQIDFKLEISQAYAVMDNVIELLTNKSQDTHLNAGILRRLGRFVEGLSVKVIRSLPLDTELLSIIEVMGDYEEDLSSSQIEALVDKIREYFGIGNRQTITEASDVMIAQIGRFLPYLNAQFELPKFPKELRPSISREMGRSSLLKVSTGQRQALLQFALKNADAGNGTMKDLTLQQQINNKDIQDLGSLKCGLMLSTISKLTLDAIDLNMEDFSECPFKDEVSEALIKRATNLDVNRLLLRYSLGNTGALLQYLDKTDTSLLNKKEISSMASFLVSSMSRLESVFKKTEENGFVLEQNPYMKELQQQRRENFTRKIYSAVKETHSDITCSKLLFLDQSIPYMETGDIDLSKCLDEIGSLHTWDRPRARKVLTEIFAKIGQSLEPETFLLLNGDGIAVISGLLKGLTDLEMKHVNITDLNTLAFVGAHNLSHEQLRIGFETWLRNQATSDGDQVSEDVLISMQNFACGMPVSFIQNRVPSQTVRNCLGCLGRRRCFKQDQMRALVSKLTEDMASTPIAKWKGHLVHEMGHLLGGLDGNALQKLTKDQIAVIEPKVITALPPENITALTVQQLKDLSPNQAAAFTAMQRSFMTDDQMAAIGRGFINGSGQNTVTNCSIVVIVLSLVRQFLVHL